MRLEGKAVLITGASEGIGAACAEAFRRRGARLCLTARSEAKLHALSANSPDDLIVPADLLHPDSPKRIVDAMMTRFGRIDVLVNNAGALAFHGDDGFADEIEGPEEIEVEELAGLRLSLIHI